jgi:hypothetical protein
VGVRELLANVEDCGLLFALLDAKENAPGRFGDDVAAADVDIEAKFVWLADAMLPLAVRECGVFWEEAMSSAKSA